MFSTNAIRPLYLNMYNFIFNFLSRGQRFYPRGFLGNLILAIIARMLCGNHLKTSVVVHCFKQSAVVKN